jgi:hypothetical protein
MRTTSLAAFTFLAVFLSAAGAHAEGSWCAQYSGRAGGTNCGFHSFQQCRATVSGIGGFCQPNPFRAYDATRGPRRRTYRREY